MNNEEIPYRHILVSVPAVLKFFVTSATMTAGTLYANEFLRVLSAPSALCGL